MIIDQDTASSFFEDALAAFRWIKGVVSMEDASSALLGEAEPPSHPTVYQTTVADQEVLLEGSRVRPEQGLRLSLHAGTLVPYTVVLGETLLADEDFEFFLKDDLLLLKLNFTDSTSCSRTGLYQRALIRFSHSGQTFTGTISELSPDQPVVWKWEGSVMS